MATQNNFSKRKIKDWISKPIQNDFRCLFFFDHYFSKNCFIYLGIHRMQYSCPHLRQWVETPVADESNSRLHTLQCLLSLQFTQSTATESSSNSALSCAKMKKKETLNCIYSQTINFSLRWNCFFAIDLYYLLIACQLIFSQ